jgi:hypothetical protein
MSAAAAGVKGRFSDIGASRQGAVREQRLMLAVLIDAIDVLQSWKNCTASAKLRRLRGPTPSRNIFLAVAFCPKQNHSLRITEG